MLVAAWLMLSSQMVFAAAKQHVVAFGKWTSIKWSSADDESKTVDVKIRPLFVDGKIKEFTVGVTHDITDHSFVVQRMYRVNDALPQEDGPSRWRWERGGWLLVDRASGKVQAIVLQYFDADLSVATWFRYYAAYCGVSDDGKKLLAIVEQLGKRKAIFKRPVGDATADSSDAQCSPPTWQRAPVRVTFQPPHDQKFTYAVRGNAIEVLSDEDDPGEE